MLFGRVGPRGAEQPVLVVEGSAFDLSAVTADIDGGFLSGDGPDRVRAAHAAGELPRVDTDGVRWGPPVRPGGSVICVGMNYAAHARESGAEPPAQPVIFLKTSGTVGGATDPVQIPRGSAKTDWEVELAVVIGRRASYLDSPEQSMDHVAGFTIADDVSERAFQLEQSGGQWSKGKCCPGFTPTGPWLATPDTFDHRDVRLRSWVNGEPRQDSTSADLIFGVEHLVWNLSQYLALEPGDLLLTGTPEGVALSGRFPYLQPGDVVETEIEGLGRQRHTFVAWQPGTGR